MSTKKSESAPARFVIHTDRVEGLNPKAEPTKEPLTVDSSEFQEMLKELGLVSPDVLTDEAMERVVSQLSTDHQLLVSLEEYSKGEIDYIECLRRSKSAPPYIPPEYTNSQYFDLLHELAERLRRGEIVISDQARRQFRPNK